MAKPPPVNKKLLTYGVFALVAAGLWLMTDSPSVRKSNGPKRPPAKHSSSKTTELFTEEDYKAHFANLNLPVKNVFRPLILPATAGGVGLAAIAPNEIPKDFTDGKTAWLYTGTAIVDGVPMALVENTETGEGEFLKVGQRWMHAVVRKITPIALVMEGPNGRVRTMDLLKEIGDGEETTLAGMDVRPVSPNLAGAIGNRGPIGSAPANGVAAQENRNDQINSAD
jgi:hypothetical protein